METTHNSVKVKLGIKVMKLVESLIGREVTVGQGSECHLTFLRGFREALMKKFGRKEPPATVRRILSEIRQKQDSNEEFGEEIRRLVTRAYPGVDIGMRG